MITLNTYMKSVKFAHIPMLFHSAIGYRMKIFQKSQYKSKINIWQWGRNKFI